MKELVESYVRAFHEDLSYIKLSYYVVEGVDVVAYYYDDEWHYGLNEMTINVWEMLVWVNNNLNK